MRILSGVQSSGTLHIGNYYGALKQFVDLQNQGEALYFIANLHALTTVRDAALARKLTFETAVAFLALGVDPKRSVLFRQSDVPEITEAFWVLGTVVPMAHLERAHSFKDKVAKGIAPDFGLFAYPVLMAVDILLYDSDKVPVGKDQKQHIEFARDWATVFNTTYQSQVFKLPEPQIQEATAVIPGIDGEKMSKSYNNTIDLFGDLKAIEKRIKSVKTDSTPPEAPKPTENNALYQLLKIMAPPSEWAALDQSWRAGGQGYGHFKGKLLEHYHATFDGPRQRYQELVADPAEVERILKDGADRARNIAAPVVSRLRKAVGL
ncbi:MAG: tryptophan--tRNA ligase [Archangiaceae bacterium]|nr:tryptophan--tRNA ligase [Archangiaceae bacterium]